ncbi:protein CHLOROPLAST IMPORT APPARATUS 2-like [Zingiber officinale]|uniref:protein CHLOROPLAST IMPORT APPARATUS 2-like n=1 Tax=Zingiber officinale TaxID=94328 RepID=UPI001C4B80F8|nr:protein CHLOROPLAST IMPORT APPARATUS 2-like [Zingiber officinale]
MSSCLSGGGGGGRTYGFDLDLVKPPPPTSSRSSHTSSPSSTLSESSNSALAISIKKARAPRKRLNQTYNEAAALLSTIYPNVFSTTGLKKLSKSSVRHFSFPEPSDDLLLPPLPVLFDAAFLLRKPHLEEPAAAAQIEFKNRFTTDKDCRSPASSSATCSFEPNSPQPFDDDFDAESILEEEVEEGIDSIMGNLSVSIPSEQDNSGGLLCGSSSINPLLRSLIGCRINGSHTDKIELGFGLGLEQNLQWALKAQDDCEWWRTPTVPVQNIVPNFKTPASKAASEKKKKKKVEKEKMCCKKITNRTVSTDTPKGKLKASLGLKLNHEEVLKEWSDRSSMFLDGAGSPESSANALAKLADLDLLPDASGGRETSVTKYKEKRRSRLFSKKIRYQVQKMNVDKQPRMKVSRSMRNLPLLQQAIKEESQ